MSVAPSLLKLPYSMIPKRLKHLLPNGEGAKGGNNLRVWKRGTGAFADAPLAPKLALRVGQSRSMDWWKPDAVMPFAEYEAALQNTRNDWEDGRVKESIMETMTTQISGQSRLYFCPVQLLLQLHDLIAQGRKTAKKRKASGTRRKSPGIA